MILTAQSSFAAWPSPNEANLNQDFIFNAQNVRSEASGDETLSRPSPDGTDFPEPQLPSMQFMPETGRNGRHSLPPPDRVDLPEPFLSSIQFMSEPTRNGNESPEITSSSSTEINPWDNAPLTEETRGQPGQYFSQNAPCNMQQNHAWPTPLEPNTFMDQQTRYLQNMIYKRTSDLYEARVELTRQSQVIERMYSQVQALQSEVGHLKDTVVHLRDETTHLDEEVSRQRRSSLHASSQIAQNRRQIVHIQHTSAIAPMMSPENTSGNVPLHTFPHRPEFQNHGDWFFHHRHPTFPPTIPWEGTESRYSSLEDDSA